MTPSQRTRLESMIDWHNMRAVDNAGKPSEHHHLAKASCIRAALDELDRAKSPCPVCRRTERVCLCGERMF